MCSHIGILANPDEGVCERVEGWPRCEPRQDLTSAPSSQLIRHETPASRPRYAVLSPQPRIKRVSKAVADEVDGQHGERDRQAWPEHARWVDGHEIGTVVKQSSPGREVWRETEAQKRQRRLRDDRRSAADAAETRTGERTLGKICLRMMR